MQWANPINDLDHGPLYGIKADEWSALAIALLVHDSALATKTEAA